MLKSCFRLSLRWLEQNSIYGASKRVCACRGKKTSRNTSIYHHSYCMKPYVSEMRSSTVEAKTGEKQGWMGRKIIPVHTHSSLGEKRNRKNVKGMHEPRT